MTGTTEATTAMSSRVAKSLRRVALGLWQNLYLVPAVLLCGWVAWMFGNEALNRFSWGAALSAALFATLGFLMLSLCNSLVEDKDADLGNGLAKIIDDENKVAEDGRYGKRSCNEIAESLLRLVVERQRLPMHQARRRAEAQGAWAFRVVVMAFVAPVGCVMAYVWTLREHQAVAQRILEQVASRPSVDLKDMVGTLTPVGDWRFLLSGVSIGFLWLAIAASLMKQTKHHSETEAALQERTVGSHALLTALRIAASKSRGAAENVAMQLVDVLLRRGTTGGAEEQKRTPDDVAQSDDTADLLPFLKRLASTAAKPGDGAS